MARSLAEDGVLTDARGSYLRLGPAPYLSDAQLEAAIERLGRAVAAVSEPAPMDSEREYPHRS